MRSYLLLTSFLLTIFGFYNASAQTAVPDAEPRPLGSTAYRMSPAAVAAGIDGNLQVGLTITAEGRAKDVRIYGGPMWPCGTNPGNAIEEVRQGVKEHVLAMHYQPQTKDGKARSSDAQITFSLSDAFKRAGEKTAGANDDRTLVGAGLMNRLAISLPKPFGSAVPRGGTVQIQVLVDETGKVVKAGSFRGNPLLSDVSVEAACRSKFKSATLNGKPVKTTGLLMYMYQ